MSTFEEVEGYIGQGYIGAGYYVVGLGIQQWWISCHDGRWQIMEFINIPPKHYVLQDGKLVPVFSPI